MIGVPRFRKQMASFNGILVLYILVTPFVIWWKDPSSLVSWIVYASTIAIFFGLGIGLDAVYYSLSEKFPSDE
jgi:hypothetical protein